MRNSQGKDQKHIGTNHPYEEAFWLIWRQAFVPNCCEQNPIRPSFYFKLVLFRRKKDTTSYVGTKHVFACTESSSSKLMARIQTRQLRDVESDYFRFRFLLTSIKPLLFQALGALEDPRNFAVIYLRFNLTPSQFFINIYHFRRIRFRSFNFPYAVLILSYFSYVWFR